MTSFNPLYPKKTLGPQVECNAIRARKVHGAYIRGTLGHMKKKVVKPGKVERVAKTKKIHVSDVQLGMYISKLDRDWLDSPFLMQGFLVESLDDIEVLADLCEHVWIDAFFEEWVNEVDRHIPSTTPGYSVRYIQKLPPQEEHKAALGVYKAARRSTKTLLDEVRLGGVINTQEAKSTVDDCVSSILRNPDALIWMSKVRNEDDHTAEHCLNVCILAIALGRHLGLDEGALKNIGLCGLLHDVGKMRINASLLQKDGTLDERETKIMQGHTVHGRNLLMATHGIYHGVIDVAYSHHEKVDGTGYPRGLKSAGISLYSKMIAIVDAFDNMTAHRQAHRSVTCTEALKTIYRNRGTQFDEKLSLAFIKAVGLYPPGTIVELVCGEVAIVIETNHRHRHLPKLIKVLNADKNKLKHEKILNLELIFQGELSKNYLIKTVHKDGTFGIWIRDYKEKGLMLSH